MREIKFRMFDTLEKNFMHGSRIVESRLLDLDNKGRFIYPQYTGLKDINGVEICEGDLVEHEMEVNGVWEEYKASPVVYDEECAMFCFEHDVPNNLTDYRNLKVIGNIFESK